MGLHLSIGEKGNDHPQADLLEVRRSPMRLEVPLLPVGLEDDERIRFVQVPGDRVRQVPRFLPARLGELRKSVRPPLQCPAGHGSVR